MGLFGCDYLETNGVLLTEYQCRYSRKQIDARTAQDICMTSRHADCMDYKNASRCFITTAVCLSMGKADDCEELTAMRQFRDKWLREQPGGPALIEEYYRVAPGIVEKIDQETDRRSIYAVIYQDYILPCVTCVKKEKYEDSKRIYVKMVNDLKTQYGM